MKCDSFASYLKKGPLVFQSRAELLAKLQLGASMFSNLDGCTLSRWANNTTTPTLEKQIICAKITKTQQFLINAYGDKRLSVPSLLDSDYERYKRSIDCSYHRVAFSTYDSLFYEHKVLQWNDYLTLTGLVREKFNFFQERFNVNNGIEAFLIRSKSGEVLSYITFIKSMKNIDYSELSDLSLPKIEGFPPITTMSFFNNSLHMYKLSGLVFNHLLKLNSFYDYILPARGGIAAKLLKRIGCVSFFDCKEKLGFGPFVYYKIPQYKLLGNPLIFNCLLDSTALYNSLFSNEIQSE